jgi:cytidylate kinase
MCKEVVAIDGPAGAGKSTVAKAVAQRLGFAYLDTGAMYRCVALLASQSPKPDLDGPAVAAIARSAIIGFLAGDPQRVHLNGQDVTDRIRTMEVGEKASTLSAFPELRSVLVTRQKAICEAGRVVLEGRDTTTVVCPDARLKVYLTASVAERARRRWKELADKHEGEVPSLEEITAQIAARDERDMTRKDSPLRIADGAVVVDTDGKSVEDVIAEVLQAWESASEALRS